MIWHDGWARGWAEARAHDILLLLEVRGIPIPTEIRKRIRECTKHSQLEAWFIRAVAAETAAEVVSGSDGLFQVSHLLARPPRQ